MLKYAAIASDGSIIGIEKTVGLAVNLAKRADPAAAVQVQHVGGGELEENPPDAAEQPLRALADCGIGQVDRRAIDMPLREAHQRLFPFFKGLQKRGGSVALYDTPMGMAKAWTGQNYKTGKLTKEKPSKVMGVTLVPAAHPVLAAAGAGPFAWLLEPDRRAEGVSMIRRWRGQLPPIALGKRPTAAELAASPRGVVLPKSFTFCAGSSQECRDSCLAFAGQNASEAYNNFRKVAQAMALLNEPAAFMRMLVESIDRFVSSKQVREGVAPFFRLNVLSDIPWELVAPWLFPLFEDLQYYDYTKVPGRLRGRGAPSNYDLTFSVSGTATNKAWADEEIKANRRVAVVFLGHKQKNGEWVPVLQKGERLLKGVPLPKTFWGLPVVDGDVSDVRPRDPSPSCVALRWKTPSGKRAGVQVDPSGANFSFVTPIYVVSAKSSKVERPNPDDDQWLIAPVSPRMQPIEGAVGADIEDDE